MANPQPNEFTRISNELYTAIMQTNFSKRQRNILDLVIRMSYGCGKKYALLHPVDFELVGVYKSHITKELNYLRAARVLFIEDTRISFNKNYDEWRISLVKTANMDRLNALLKRNLDSYQNSNEVTKTVTTVHDETEKNVTETVTEVTEMVTSDQSENRSEVTKTVTLACGEVTKTVTDRDTQTYSGVVSGVPKEKVYKDLKEKLVTPPLPPPREPKSIEDIFPHFPRYNIGQLALIRQYWNMIRFTRKHKKVAASVILHEMEYWERFPVEIVHEALKIHIQKHQTKREDYTSGIMRRLVEEAERDGTGSIQPPAQTGIIDRSKFTYQRTATN